MKLLEAILREGEDDVQSTTILPVIDRREKNLKSLKDIGVDFNHVGTLKVDSNKISRLDDVSLPSKLTGSFSCDHNALVSLKGSPKKVGGYFSVADNKKLTSLEGGPEEVARAYYCSRTGITTLKGIAKVIGTSVYALGCNLVSLEGLNTRRLADFDVSGNKLVNLVGGPTHDCDDYNAAWNNLVSLKGAPTRVRAFDASHNEQLTSLEGIGHEYLTSCEYLDVRHCPIKSHVLGLVLMQGVNGDVELHADFEGSEVIMPFVGKGHDALIDAQHALIDAGFEDLAQL